MFAPGGHEAPAGEGRFAAYGRIALLGLVTSLGIPAQWLAVKLGLSTARTIPVLYHRIVCRTLGIRRIVEGVPPPPGKPALILANHVSWLDITVLGSLRPLSFIAKNEVGGWPLFGTLARLQRTVFIDRSRRKDTHAVSGEVGARLAAGEAIVLFAEGTTGDGARILPFRSALVGAARAALAEIEGDQLDIHPLTIAYIRRGGLPLGRAGLPDVAWYGDMDLAPHLIGVLRGGPFDVRLIWGEPIPFGDGHDRKGATRLAEERVRTAMRAARAAG
jgi:1-acyl-sn-glycerol-3-phosphate acyltransferase